MIEETIHVLEERFRACPPNKGEAVELPEIEAAARVVGVPFGVDYTDFIRRYGGGVVGAYEIVGLRRAKYMGGDIADVMDLTKHFRDQGWPGAERWAVFSVDQGGNPIGLDDNGKVWLSDHDAKQVVAICETFEQFLRTWALGIEPEPTKYYGEMPWPSSLK
jgi:hypothetical protein